MGDVGIVMPVYTQEPSYLRMALRSILKQRYSRFTFVIVIDGASQDTVQIIETETHGDPRVKIIDKKENQGVAKALNTGFKYLIKLSGIKYLTWVSSDNIYYSRFIGKLRQVLRRSPANVGLVYSSFRHIDENGNPHQNPSLVEFRKYQEQPKENLLDACFIGVSFMYKKQFTEGIDGYHLEPVEDYDYWLRLTECCEIRYVPLELMDYRTNSRFSISSQLRDSQEKHRLWRHALNVAKQQARNRRSIPYETTVLFPVKDASATTLERFEKILEQSYSNFRLVILDISKKEVATAMLKNIPDPRVSFVPLPNLSEKEAVNIAIKGVKTLFVLIYGKGRFPTCASAFYNMALLLRQLSKKGSHQKSVATFEDLKGKPNARNIFSSNEPVYDELFPTSKLLEILQAKK